MEKLTEKTTAESPALEKPSFKEAFKFWLKLGFISFGGPAGQIAVMHRELVERKKWIDEESFLHALNFCMLLPGPEAQQLATYSGWRLHGIRGGIAAGAFFVIPSIFFLLALSFVYAKFGNVAPVAAVLAGFKPVVVAIVVEAVLKIGKKAFKTRVHVLIAALSFVAIYFLRVPFPLIVAGAAVLGFLLAARNPQTESRRENKTPVANHKSRILKIIAVFFGLWLVPLIAVLAIFGRENLAFKVYLFFTQAAFVTFGGAYAVLAYVNQAAVEAGWITAAQAIDGLALAETTPGPLIMVLQFIGFMTGWNNAGDVNQTFLAASCALLATFATFLPSFFFIFAGAPYIENLRGNPHLSSALSGVTAAVVGVILNLALIFGAAVVFPGFQPDPFALVLTAAAFLALYFLKLDVLLIVIAGGLCGLAKYLLFG